MKALSVIGIIVGIIFIGIAFLYWIGGTGSTYLGQAVYLVGGAVLIIISSLLYSIQNLIDSVKNSPERIGIILNNYNKLTTSTIAPVRTPSKYAATDFEGIPRKPGESGAEYWDRVEKETKK